MAKKKKIAVLGTSLFDIALQAIVPQENQQPEIAQEPVVQLPIQKTEIKAESGYPQSGTLAEPPMPPTVPVVKTVRLRDGEILKVGDHVTIDDGVLTGLLKESHQGKVFVIEKMTDWKTCESGVLVIAYDREKPEAKTTGIAGKGIDANWFKKVTA